MNNDKFSWLSKFEKTNILWLIVGTILLLVGGSKVLNYPKGSLILDGKYNIAIMSIGVICLLVSLILTFVLRPKDSTQTGKNVEIQPANLNLNIARDHLLNEVLPEYRRKTPLTLSDKKDAMAAILRMLSLTTIPSTKENLARVGLFEIMKNGRFRILAAHHIDAHRLLKLENLFRHDKNNPVGVIGYSVAKRKTVKIDDLENPPEEYKGLYEITEDNKLPTQKARSILVIPIYRNIHLPNSEMLGALSITTSERSFFTEEHEKELEDYVNIIRSFLDHFETNISFNPPSKQSARIITISGQSGSGKTTLASKLHFYLKFAKWEYVSIGDKFREHCKNEGIDIEKNTEEIPDYIHKKFDIFQKELLTHEENIIVDGRMPGYFAHELGLKDVFRIYCDLSLDERTARVLNRAKEEGKKIRDVKKLVADRDYKDIETYKKLYGIQDFRNREYYSLYLNMQDNAENLARKVFEELTKIK